MVQNRNRENAMQYNRDQIEYERRRRIEAQRRERIRRERIRRARRNRMILRAVLLVVSVALVLGLISLVRSCGKKDEIYIPPVNNAEQDSSLDELENYPAFADDGADISSECVLLIDLSENRVICEKNSTERVRIASLTKIMTAIVALENLDDYDETYTFDRDIIEYLTSENSAVAGFEAGEEVKAIDLLYAAMLPSGGDGAMGIAALVGGSQEEFVEMMNEKATSLGMSRTHFTNATGFDDDDNYSCAYDVSLMFEYALKNEKFREMIATEKYITSPTNEHPDGLTFVSTVYRGFESNDIEFEGLQGGKTGYTGDAGLCLATFAELEGSEYILITLGAGDGSNYPQFHFLDAEKLYSAFVG